MRILAAFLLLILTACASAPVVTKGPPNKAEALCSTLTTAEFAKVLAKLPEIETLEGEQMQIFMGLASGAGPLKLDRADKVLVAHDDKMFLAGFFLNDCAVAHIAGPWSAIKQFFGRKA